MLLISAAKYDAEELELVELYQIAAWITLISDTGSVTTLLYVEGIERRLGWMIWHAENRTLTPETGAGILWPTYSWVSVTETLG